MIIITVCNIPTFTKLGKDDMWTIFRKRDQVKKILLTILEILENIRLLKQNLKPCVRHCLESLPRTFIISNFCEIDSTPKHRPKCNKFKWSKFSWSNSNFGIVNYTTDTY